MVAPSEKDLSPLPGDELIPLPVKVISHDVIINAPVEFIWPWLMQLGAGRAGWYSYDWIDNGGNPSAKKIIPELQHAAAGDIFPAVPGSKDAFIVREVHPGKALVLVVPVKSALEDTDTYRRMNGPLRVSWTLYLEKLENDKTRLISKGRISADWLTPPAAENHRTKKPVFIERVYSLLARLPWSITAPIAMAGHYLMESRMLHGIKQRAEAIAGNQAKA